MDGAYNWSSALSCGLGYRLLNILIHTMGKKRVISDMTKFAYKKLLIILRMTKDHEELCPDLMKQVNQ